MTPTPPFPPPRLIIHTHLPQEHNTMDFLKGCAFGFVCGSFGLLIFLFLAF